jgi:RES domain-containing protein
MNLYRVCKRRNADLSGIGAKITGGRWNSPGNAVVYCSENRSLAALEYLAHFTDLIIPDELVLLSVSVPSDSPIQEIKLNTLPGNWRAYPAPAQLMELGDDWLRRNESLLLKVPSVIIENEYNYLINPSHRDIRKVKIVKKEKFNIDRRLAQK